MRAEHVKCVMDTTVGREHLTWCGRTHFAEFVFQDIDHAALNGRQGGRLTVCQQCRKAIVLGLWNKGWMEGVEAKP